MRRSTEIFLILNIFIFKKKLDVCYRKWSVSSINIVILYLLNILICRTMDVKRLTWIQNSFLNHIINYWVVTANKCLSNMYFGNVPGNIASKNTLYTFNFIFSFYYIMREKSQINFVLLFFLLPVLLSWLKKVM